MRWRHRQEEELVRDIAEHVALETDFNIARGMSPADARSAALRKFGNVALVMEDARRVWTWPMLDTWRADLRQALRRLRRSPGTAALAILSLALAFAPSVTIFSVMDRLFLTPLAIEAPSEIVEIGFRDTRPGVKQPFVAVSYPEFQDFSRSLHSFSGMAYDIGHGAMVVVEGRRSVVGIAMVNDDYLRVLGVPVRSGPGLLKDRASLVISHNFWTREFHAMPDIFGRTLLVDGVTFTVGGVAAPEFQGTGSVFTTDLWIPALRSVPEASSNQRRDDRAGTLWGRLRPGVSLAAATAEVEGVTRQLAEQWPATNRYLKSYTWAPLAERRRGGITLTSIAVILLGLLMAVACANVAGILLARAEERRHETAIRQALGASRGRLMREWMVESAVLSSLAAALGLAAAKVLMKLLPALLPSMILPIHVEFSFGVRVWLYAASLIFASALTFGLVPAWRGSRPDLLSGLRQDSAVSIFRARVPVRSLLVVAQIAVAEVLLFGAGVVLDTVSGVSRLDPGFDPHRRVAMAVVIAADEKGAAGQMDCESVRQQLAGIGGVRRAAYGHILPLSGTGGPMMNLDIPGQEPRQVKGGTAGPGFLSILGTRMLAGRDLEPADQRGVLVNKTLALQLDPSANVVGREIRLDGTIRQIVGVFQDVKTNTIYDPPEPRAILLTPSKCGGDLAFAIEVAGDPSAYAGLLRARLMAAQPTSAVLSSKTLWQQFRDSLFLEFSATRLFYGLGLLALLLTVTGLHGITRALFARRSKEFAIRLALGAAPRQIVTAVMASALKLALFGLALGLAIALPCGWYIASQVHGFSAWTAPAVGLSSAIVLAAAILAAAQPARRVFRIQPGDIVRAE